MNTIVVDTSSIIAVVLNEPEKEKLVELTIDAELIAPPSTHWEVGNALSAMFKRRRLKFSEAVKAIKEYRSIPIQFSEVDLEASLKIAEKEGMYAYDAYILICAKKHKAPILTLDSGLKERAIKNDIKVLEVRL